MIIYECCPYFNEDEVAQIKIEEGRSWIDQIHVVEANRTFKYAPKDYEFPFDDPLVIHHKLDATVHFRGPSHWGISRRFPFFRNKSSAWVNEAIQRNYAASRIEPAADDIVILSDIDEIIDSRHAEEICDMAKTHGIITVPLHFTMFYLDLLSTNWDEVWPRSPPDFAYRVFVMTGDHFNNMRISSNTLRRRAESSRYVNKFPRLQHIGGFHHSWLGGYDAIRSKLQSYAHADEDHDQEIFTDSGELDMEALRNRLASGRSIFRGHELELMTASDVDYLRAIISRVKSYAHLFMNPNTVEALANGS